MAVIEYKDLPGIREKHKNEKIVFCSGSFDLPHGSHVVSFENFKKYGDILVVGVGKDTEIKKNKGPDRPILTEDHRLTIIDSIRHTDYSFLTKIPEENEHYLSPLGEVFDLLKPDVYVFNDDANEIAKREEIAGAHNVEVKILGHVKDFPSTTSTIEKIRKLPE